MACLAVLTAAAFLSPVHGGAGPWQGAAPAGQRPLGALPMRSANPMERSFVGTPPLASASSSAYHPLQVSPFGSPTVSSGSGFSWDQPSRAVWVSAESLTSPRISGEVERCPGHGNDLGGGYCNEDSQARVCMKLLDGNREPLTWTGEFGDGDFWKIMKFNSRADSATQRDIRRMKYNKGDSYCLSMWWIEEFIETVGCENVPIRCGATDIGYIYSGVQIGKKFGRKPAVPPLLKECLAMQCGSPGAGSEEEAMALVSSPSEANERAEDVVRFLRVVSVLGAFGAILAVAATLRRRTSTVSVKPMLG